MIMMIDQRYMIDMEAIPVVPESTIVPLPELQFLAVST